MKTARLAGHTIQVGGLGMFTRVGGEAGAGPDPIVLVHGAVVSGRYMVPTAERLAVSHRVLVPDLPGFGHSEDPARPLRVPELASALLAWLDAAGVARAHIVGNSLGAQVAVAAAQAAPHRVGSLILVGPTVDREARTRVRQLWRLAKDAPRERWSLIPLHLRDILRAGWRFAASTLDIALEDRIEERLAVVRVPTLIVCGSSDPLAPEEWCRWLAGVSPMASVQVLEGPHALNYSRPDTLAACVHAWLSGLTPRR